MAAFNGACALALGLALLVPDVRSASVELKLVEIVPATAPAPLAAVPRPGIPPAFRPHDLSQRPWEDLPGGGVRLRDR